MPMLSLNYLRHAASPRLFDVCKEMIPQQQAGAEYQKRLRSMYSLVLHEV